MLVGWLNGCSWVSWCFLWCLLNCVVILMMNCCYGVEIFMSWFCWLWSCLSVVILLSWVWSGFFLWSLIFILWLLCGSFWCLVWIIVWWCWGWVFLLFWLSGFCMFGCVFRGWLWWLLVEYLIFCVIMMVFWCFMVFLLIIFIKICWLIVGLWLLWWIMFLLGRCFVLSSCCSCIGFIFLVGRVLCWFWSRWRCWVLNWLLTWWCLVFWWFLWCWRGWIGLCYFRSCLFGGWCLFFWFVLLSCCLRLCFWWRVFGGIWCMIRSLSISGFVVCLLKWFCVWELY